MASGSLKGSKLMLVSGVFNCLLSIIHFAVLYITYQGYSKLIPPEAAMVLTDTLLFSLGIGTTLLFTGALICYCYFGFLQKQKWAYVISSGAAILLLCFSLSTIVLMGPDHPIAHIHLLNSVMIGVPLVLNRKVF